MKKFLLSFVLCGLMTVSMGRPLLAGDLKGDLNYVMGVVLERSWFVKFVGMAVEGGEVDWPSLFAAEDLAWINAYSSDFLPRFLK